MRNQNLVENRSITFSFHPENVPPSSLQIRNKIQSRLNFREKYRRNLGVAFGSGIWEWHFGVAFWSGIWEWHFGVVCALFLISMRPHCRLPDLNGASKSE